MLHLYHISLLPLIKICVFSTNEDVKQVLSLVLAKVCNLFFFKKKTGNIFCYSIKAEKQKMLRKRRTASK